MERDESWTQLMALRAMTERTQTLHDAQILQLKIWPRILFQASIKSVFKVDFPKRRIAFDITNGAGKKQEIKVRAADAPPILDEWTKTLLGEDWTVVVNVRGKKAVKAKTYRFPGKELKKETVEELCERLAREDREASQSL